MTAERPLLNTTVSAVMKILLVQTGFLGDTVLSTPVIGGIKRAYPDSELWVLTTPAAKDLVIRDPELKGVLVFDKRGTAKGISGMRKFASELKAAKFDVAFSLHKSSRTALLLRLARIPRRVGFSRSSLAFLYTETIERPDAIHEVGRALSLIVPNLPLDARKEYEAICNGSVSQPLGQLRLFLPSSDELSNDVRAMTNGNRRYVVLVPGSAWETKRWDWIGFRDVARSLIRDGIEVILVGSPDEAAIAEAIAAEVSVTNFAGRTSLAEAMYLIAKSEGIVCNDSLSLHIASARKVPTVAVFCATTPKFGFGPWQERAAVVERNDLFCKPCCRHGARQCPHGTNACMNDIDFKQVVTELYKVSGLRER